MPDYHVEADGASIMGPLSGRVLQLSVTDKAGVTSDGFDLLLDDKDDLIDPPRKGAKIKIWMGYRAFGPHLGPAGLTYLGEFVVDEVEVTIAPRRLRITGKGADMREKLKSPKTKGWGEGNDDLTLQKVMSKIAGDHKLELKIASDIGAKKVPDFVQSEESDLHLATRIAEKYGAIVKYADGKMIVAKRGAGEATSGKAMPTIVLTLSDLIGGRGKLKDRERYGAAKATWHDQAKAKRVTVTEKQGDGPDYELRQTYQSEAEARDACKAKLADLQRRSADVSLTIPGDATVCAEAKLLLVGVSRKLDGDWIVEQARHVMSGSGSGFQTQIEAKTPGQR